MINFLKCATRVAGLHKPGRTRSTPAVDAPSHVAAEGPPWAIEVPRYPPVDPGLPVVPVQAIIASQRDLIDRLRQAAAFDEPTFERRCLAPIEGVARYVHLLPASAFEHFAGAGGLFRFAIEMAFYSRLAAEGCVFNPSACAEARRQLEPRWKYACFLAGLLGELHRPLASLAVTDESGRVWPTFLGGLDGWLRSVGASHYHVGWHGGPTGPAATAEGAAVFGDIVPKEALEWLHVASPSLVAEVLGAALGQAGQVAGVGAVVSATRERVLHADESTRRSRYGRLRIGHHLELHLIDAIRQRVVEGQWTANEPAGPLWFGTDGLFLEWPVAANVIREDLLRTAPRGIPTCAFTMADVLGRAGLLMEAAPGDWLWPVQAGTSGRCTALKFLEPRSVLGYADVRPVERSIGSSFGGRPERLAPPDRIARSPELPPAETRMVDSWRECLLAQRPGLLAWLPGGALAVSQDLLAMSGTDLACAATALHRRQWLGRGDWPSPGARAGLLSFSGTLKPGLVVNEKGVRQLGLLAPEH